MTTPAPNLRPGDQLASTTRTTRVVVLQVAGDRDPVIECGGSPMVTGAPAVKPSPPGPDASTLIGKCYVDATQTVEVLCTSVRGAAQTGLPEIWLWGTGDEAPADFGAGADPVAHRLSVAARAFKAQAMAAAALGGHGTADTEVFRRGEVRRLGMTSAR